MLYELRVYEIAPGKMPAIISRFANVTLDLFKKHGIKPVLFLEPVLGVSNQLTYLLQWESLGERETRWNAFASDPEWIAARAETEKAGPIVLRFTNTMLQDVSILSAKIREMQG